MIKLSKVKLDRILGIEMYSILSLGKLKVLFFYFICVVVGKREYCFLKREWDVRERRGRERNSSYRVFVRFLDWIII